MKTKCPLCDRELEIFDLTDRGRKKYFECSKCKAFVAGDRALKIISASDARKAQIAKASSKLDEEHLLHIFLQQGEKGTEVKSKVELRSKWK